MGGEKRGFQGVGVLRTPHHKITRCVMADQLVEQGGKDEQPRQRKVQSKQSDSAGQF